MHCPQRCGLHYNVPVECITVFKKIRGASLVPARWCIDWWHVRWIASTLRLWPIDFYENNSIEWYPDTNIYYDSIQSDRAILEAEWLKGTAGLCCGYAAYYAPPELVPSRVDAVIVKMLLPLFKNVKVISIVWKYNHVWWRIEILVT